MAYDAHDAIREFEDLVREIEEVAEELITGSNEKATQERGQGMHEAARRFRKRLNIIRRTEKL